MSTISGLYDVTNKLLIDVLLAPAYTSENHLALEHLKHVRKGDLIILDRGYRCLWLLLAIRNQGADFLVRLSAFAFPEMKDFARSAQQDAIITITPSKHVIKSSKDVGIQAIPLTARFIKVVLANGEIEYLLTSLCNEKRYPITSFYELYFLRWGIEEAFKTLKSVLEVGRFSGKTCHAVEQDFYSAILLHNMQAIFIEDEEVQQKVSKKTENRLFEYQVNKTTTLFYLKRELLNLLLGKNMKKTIDLIKERITEDLLPVRDNRYFKRKLDDIAVAKPLIIKSISA